MLLGLDQEYLKFEFLIGHIPLRPQTSRICRDQVIVKKHILVSLV